MADNAMNSDLIIYLGLVECVNLRVNKAMPAISGLFPCKPSHPGWLAEV
jgi:hypothetical protein